MANANGDLSLPDQPYLSNTRQFMEKFMRGSGGRSLLSRTYPPPPPHPPNRAYQQQQ